jgi:hypothetical protein
MKETCVTSAAKPDTSWQPVDKSNVSIAVKKDISPLTVVNDSISEAKTLTLSAITAEGLDISLHIAIIIHRMIKAI